MPISDFRNRPSSFTVLLALILTLMGAGSMLYYHLGLFVPNVLAARTAKGLGGGYALGNDFYPIWLTARQCLPQHCDPYSPQMTREIQIGLFGRALDANIPTDPPTDYRSLAYPAFTDILFAPAAVLPFPILRILLVIILPLFTALSVWLWLLAIGWRPAPVWMAVIILLALCNYPVLEALFAEQPGLVVGFLLASAALALQRGRPVIAGILMALTTIKPQMTLLAILYFLFRSLYEHKAGVRFMIGFFATMTFLVGASLLLWPHWIQSWMSIVLGYHRYATPPLVTDMLGLDLGSRLGPILIAALLVFAVALAWRKRLTSIHSSEFWLTLSLLLAITSVTLLPGQAIYDHVILFPGVLLLLQGWRDANVRGSFRRLQIIGAAILFWPWLTAFALIVARPWLRPEIFYSTTLFALPLRTAASFPFAVLALLAVTLRNETRNPTQTVITA
jgi:Glycosyltransferase family 87